MDDAACLSLWPFTCSFLWHLVLISRLLITKQNNPRFPDVYFQLPAFSDSSGPHLPECSVLSPQVGAHVRLQLSVHNPLPCGDCNCGDQHLPAPGPIPLSMVAPGTSSRIGDIRLQLFSGVLGTLGKQDRGVMKGNRLPVPILFSLL